MPIKHYHLLIPNSVKVALKHQVDYIVKEQHAPLIANKWLDGITKAINSLSQFPDRCPIAPENSYIKKDSKIIIRHFIYKKTFRRV